MLAPLVASLAVVGLWSFGARRELWFDERYVQLIGQLPWHEMFTHLRLETNPPLFFSLVHLWQQIGGSGEVWLRTLPLVCTIAGMFALFWFSKEAAGNKVATLAVMLAAVATQTVTQAAELRVYPLVFCFTSCALALTLRYQATQRSHGLWWWVVVSFLGLMSHYTFILVVIFSGGWLLAVTRQWKKLLFAGAVLGALCTPWFVYSVWPKLVDGTSQVLLERLTSSQWSALAFPARQLVSIEFLDRTVWIWVQGIIAAIFVAGLFVSYRLARQRRTLYFVLGIFGFELLLLFMSRLSLLKYSTVMLPVTLIIVATVRASIASRRLLLVSTSIVLLMLAGGSFLNVRIPFSTYRAAAQTVVQSERPGDVLLIFPFNDVIALQPYYKGRLTPFGYFPSKAPGMFTLDDVTINNYRVFEEALDVRPLEDYVGDAGRVWFLYNVSPTVIPGLKIDRWFIDHGYSRITYTEIFERVPPLLVRYDKVVP